MCTKHCSHMCALQHARFQVNTSGKTHRDMVQLLALQTLTAAGPMPTQAQQTLPFVPAHYAAHKQNRMPQLPRGHLHMRLAESHKYNQVVHDFRSIATIHGPSCSPRFIRHPPSRKERQAQRIGCHAMVAVYPICETTKHEATAQCTP